MEEGGLLVEVLVVVLFQHREPYGAIAEREGEYMEEHMHRVGKVGEAALQNAADNFRDKGQAYNQNRKEKLNPRGAARIGAQAMDMSMFTVVSWLIVMEECITHSVILPDWRAIRGLEP